MTEDQAIRTLFDMAICRALTGGLLSFAGMRREQNAREWLRENTDGTRDDGAPFVEIGRLQ